MSIDSSTRSLRFATMDVFTNWRFVGNPLAIVEVPKGAVLTQPEKQAIAREFNFSETVFLHEDDGSPDGRRFDIFTITEELNFAGHPTIGTLCYIGSQLGVAENSSALPIKLLAKAGTISARYDASTRLAEADIPHRVNIHAETVNIAHVIKSQPQIESAINSLARSHERNEYNDFPMVSIVKGMTYMLVRLPSVSDCLDALRLGQVPIAAPKMDDGWAPSFVAPYFYVILPEAEDGTIKIRSRMIDPEIGEDPATGSAACTLASYLALQAGGISKTYGYHIEQGVEMGRPSSIKVQVALDGSGKAVKRVSLSGTSVPVTQGILNV